MLERALGSRGRFRRDEALAERTLAELGFVREGRPSGPLHVCRTAFGVQDAIGRVGIRDARCADLGLVSLLSFLPELAVCGAGDLLFLDIETTGLGRGASTTAFLVGLAAFVEEEGEPKLRVEQVALADPEHERAMLEYVFARVERARVLVTYNGRAYDLPLLETRATMQQLLPPQRRPHLDLLHVARRVHRSRKMRCTLGNVEREVCGVRRGLDIPSDEIAPRYHHFLRTGDARELESTFSHNVQDILSMVALVGAYGAPLTANFLDAADYADVARTARQTRAWTIAERAAERAVEEGARREGMRERAEVAKAVGDRDRALVDYEAYLELAEDPSVRLALAKLYEHHVRDFDAASRHAAASTGEGPEAHARRLARLREKARRVRDQPDLFAPSSPELSERGNRTGGARGGGQKR